MSERPHTSTATLLWVYVALMALLGVTVGAAYLDLGVGNTIVNLAIAVLKALLIAWFYMQLRAAENGTRLFAVIGLVWLVPMFWLALLDYTAR